MSHWSTVINEYYDNWKEQLVPMKSSDLKIIQEQYRQQQLIKQYNATQEAIKAVRARNKSKKNTSKKKVK